MWPGNGIGRSRPLLALALALVAAGLLPGELSAAKKAKAGLPAGSAVQLYRFQVRRFREPDR